MFAALLAALACALLLPPSGFAGPPIVGPIDFCNLVTLNCVSVEITTVDGNGSGTITSSPAGSTAR